MLTTFLDKVRKSVIFVDTYASIDYPTPETREKRNQTFKEAAEAFAGAIPAVRKALEDEFRKILGVEDSRLPHGGT